MLNKSNVIDLSLIFFLFFANQVLVCLHVGSGLRWGGGLDGAQEHFDYVENTTLLFRAPSIRISMLFYCLQEYNFST